jgi:hypothetical protein
MQHTYTQFNGNLELYNDPRYIAANNAFYAAIELLKQCGMEHNQACNWMKSWGYQD